MLVCVLFILFNIFFTLYIGINLIGGERGLISYLEKKEILNNLEIKEELKEYLSRISPEQEKIVKLHKKDTPIFQEFNITKQIFPFFFC